MKRFILLTLSRIHAIFVCCIVFTTIMALIPIEDVPNPFNLWDKTQHALAFVVLTITGCLAYPQKTKVVYIGLILYGASIEIMQSTLTITRIGEISDLLADSVGVGIGFIIYLLVRKNIQSNIYHGHDQ